MDDTTNLPAPLDLERAANAYIHMRDARSVLAEKFKEDDDALKAKMTVIQNALLKYLDAGHINSVKTDKGTIYRQEEITPQGSDWDVFYKWIRQNDAFDALERRIKKTFIRTFMDTNDGAIPPGVSVFREFVIRVRRT